MFKRAVKILHARIGIVSNNEALINEPRYFEGQVMESLLTNIHSIEKIPYTDDLDAHFVIIDDPHIHPDVRVTDQVITASGDFSRYEKECSDNRYSLFGNLGLLFKILLVTLERQSQHLDASTPAPCTAPPARPSFWSWAERGPGRPSFSLKGWRTTGGSSARR